MTCFCATASATSAFQAKHQTIFPNKNLLQLKIREVRQRMMAEAQVAIGVDQREASTPISTMASSSATTATSTSQMLVNKTQQGSSFSASNTSADDDQFSDT